MSRFYANENIALQVVENLRALGHDVLTTSEAGKADQAIPDEQVLQFATEQERILLTFNRKHFIRLHKSGESHRGIIVCTFDADFAALAQRIHSTVGSDDLAGVLVRINRPPTPSVKEGPISASGAEIESSQEKH